MPAVEQSSVLGLNLIINWRVGALLGNVWGAEIDSAVTDAAWHPVTTATAIKLFKANRNFLPNMPKGLVNVTSLLDRESTEFTSFYNPASARNTAALSVASQVKSGSSRPKWP